MILKFDHISYSCGEGEVDCPNGYEQAFCELHLENIPCKMEFLKFNSSWHNLVMFKPMDKLSVLPNIEYTEYPMVDEKNKGILNIVDGGIEISSFRPNETAELLIDIGLKKISESLDFYMLKCAAVL